MLLHAPSSNLVASNDDVTCCLPQFCREFLLLRICNPSWKGKSDSWEKTPDISWCFIGKLTAGKFILFDTFHATGWSWQCWRDFRACSWSSPSASRKTCPATISCLARIWNSREPWKSFKLVARVCNTIMLPCSIPKVPKVYCASKALISFKISHFQSWPPPNGPKPTNFRPLKSALAFWLWRSGLLAQLERYM